MSSTASKEQQQPPRGHQEHHVCDSADAGGHNVSEEEEEDPTTLPLSSTCTPTPSDSSLLDCKVAGEEQDDNTNNNDHQRRNMGRKIHPIAQTLEGRLLCAAECAYEIRSPYFGAVGYLPGTQAQRLSKGVNSVLIGRILLLPDDDDNDGNDGSSSNSINGGGVNHTDAIVVSFRGTRGGSPLDWLQNAALFLKQDNNNNGNNKVPGKVHSGFYRAARALYGPLKKSLFSYIKDSLRDKQEGGAPPIYLTGHSKGGSLASLVALLMTNDPQLPNPTMVCTFGAARVGNKEFRNAFNGLVYQKTYENHLDLIPLLPPSRTTMETIMDNDDEDGDMTEMMDEILWSDTERRQRQRKKGSKKEEERRRFQWSYEPIGQRLFIRANGTIVDDVTKDLDDDRIRDIENRTFRSFREFRAAHCSSCPSEGCNGGYFLAIAPEVCANQP